MRLHTAPEELFWYWIQERHQMYRRRFEWNHPKPWTDDPILRDHRFTNVFRELDAGTVWMRENLTEPNRDRPFPEILLNCSWYRLFNLIATGEFLGWQSDWDVEAISSKLQARKDGGTPIFTHAHVVRGENGLPKALSISQVVEEIWCRSNSILKTVREECTLESMFRELKKVYLIGDFMAYEITTDLRHTPVLEDAIDIMTWANLGPGAVKGIRRLGYNTRDGAGAMRELLSHAPKNLPSDFPPLEMRDMEHSLCEFDKYCRVKFNEGAKLRPYKGRV